MYGLMVYGVSNGRHIIHPQGFLHPSIVVYWLWVLMDARSMNPMDETVTYPLGYQMGSPIPHLDVTVYDVPFQVSYGYIGCITQVCFPGPKIPSWSTPVGGKGDGGPHSMTYLMHRDQEYHQMIGSVGNPTLILRIHSLQAHLMVADTDQTSLLLVEIPVKVWDVWSYGVCSI